MRIENLEPRQMLAAAIDRIQFSPSSQNIAHDQYFEVRGEASAVLPSGTYLVAINSEDSSVELGDIHALFDLGQTQLGSNGRLVLAPSGSNYQFDSGTRVIKGNDGLRGASGWIADGNADALRVGSLSFLLIQSSIAPTLTDDIDSNDDGVPDGVYMNWSILDGVAVLKTSDNAGLHRSYAPVVFTEGGIGTHLDQSTVISTGALGTVAGVNQSTGHTANEWSYGFAPDVLSINLQVAENSPAGTSIGAVVYADLDPADTVRFEILSQTQPWATVNSATGGFSVAPQAVIDYEAGVVDVVTVRITDSAGLQNIRHVVISALDVNEAPYLSIPIQNQPATVGEAFSMTVPPGTFRDPDVGDSLQLSMMLANGNALPSWLAFDESTSTLSGTPPAEAIGQHAIQVTARDRGNNIVGANFSLIVQLSAFPWHNATTPEDVNQDGVVTPLDALWVINFINAIGPRAIAAGSPPASGLLDTNRDNVVSAIDALLIINQINSRLAGEGEFDNIAAVDLCFVERQHRFQGIRTVCTPPH